MSDKLAKYITSMQYIPYGHVKREMSDTERLPKIYSFVNRKKELVYPQKKKSNEKLKKPRNVWIWLRKNLSLFYLFMGPVICNINNFLPYSTDNTNFTNEKGN